MPIHSVYRCEILQTFRYHSTQLSIVANRHSYHYTLPNIVGTRHSDAAYVEFFPSTDSIRLIFFSRFKENPNRQQQHGQMTSTARSWIQWRQRLSEVYLVSRGWVIWASMGTQRRTMIQSRIVWNLDRLMVMGAAHRIPLR